MRGNRSLLATCFVTALFLAACSSARSIDEAADTLDPSVTSSTSSTTTAPPPNRAPTVRSLDIGRVEIGQRFTDAIVAFDPEGDDVVVRLSDGPLGFSPVVNTRGRITGFEFAPTEPGEWTIEVSATDPSGAVGTAELQLIARHPRDIDLVLAMGDSIAAGFGRDRSDFFGTETFGEDECFRSEADAYGLLATERLIEVGSLTAETQVLLAACAGADSRSISTAPLSVVDRNGDVAEPVRGGPAAQTQLDWATSLNPTIITLTVGGGDLGLFDAEMLAANIVSIDGPRLGPELESTLGDMGAELAALLDRLTETTDAHIAVTTYFDPTASDPIGIEDCQGQCFAAAMAVLIGAVNERIIDAATNARPGRVSLVRLDVDDSWEAGGALGPDAARGGLGPFQGIVDRFTGGSIGPCADSGQPEVDLVSSLDCIHPNSAGHREVATRVAEELLSI